jgi:predicted ferric reductase
MRNKIIFWTILVATLGLVPLTILPTLNFAVIRMPNVALSVFQRVFGLSTFVLLFWQIIIGANMESFAKKVGNWIFNFHVWEGIVIYSLIVLHPLMFMFLQHFVGRGTDPINVFLGVCLFCNPKIEYIFTLGRIAFWLLTIGVFAGFYRHANSFMKANWRKFHALNYVAFLLVGIHGFIFGPDLPSKSFIYFAIPAYLIVLYTILRKLPDLFTSYKNWLKSD